MCIFMNETVKHVQKSCIGWNIKSLEECVQLLINGKIAVSSICGHVIPILCTILKFWEKGGETTTTTTTQWDLTLLIKHGSRTYFSFDTSNHYDMTSFTCVESNL